MMNCTLQIALPLMLCFFFSNIGFGQNPVVFEHITTENGLSQSDINTIYQDKKGFMWFATHDGLNKYDGYGFTVYKPDPNKPGSISSNLIYNIEGDADGNLWIGTTGSGLNYFDRATEKFIHYEYDKDNLNSLNDNHIRSVYRDRQDRLWIGTPRGINLVDLQTISQGIEFQRFKPQLEPITTGGNISSVNTIFEDSRSQLWIGGYGGIYRLSRNQDGEMYFRFVNQIIGLPDVSVRCINEDNNGRLIIGTEKGLYLQSNNNDSLKVNKIGDGHFNDLLIDNNNAIWAGTDDGLLYFESLPEDEFPKLTNRFTYNPQNPNSLSKNIVSSIFKDKTGVIWVGTNGGGINKFDPERKQFLHVRKTLDPKSLSYDKIRAFYEDSNENLWIGTEGGGLNLLNEKNNEKEFIHLNTIPKIFAITEVRNGDKKKLLFGGEDTPGLFEINITESEKISRNEIVAFEEINHSVFSLLTDDKNNIWIGTYSRGIHRWIPQSDGKNPYVKQSFTADPNDPKSISNDIIRSIYQDGKGNIWFATGDGLSKLSQNETTKKYPKFDVFKNEIGNTSSLSHNYVLAIYESKAGDLWIGTFGGGLNKYIPASGENPPCFKSFSEKDGLPNNVIKGILEDEEGNLWLSTNKGLSKFDPKSITFKNYDVHDGLQSNEFQELACLKRKSGEMFFGGINGYNAFTPKHLKENTFEAETVLTNFSIFNRPVPIKELMNGRIILEKTINNTKEIKLKHWENSISFEFAALHYSAPYKNQFAYKLEGFDEDWTYTSTNKRFVSYTNLGPGTYTLHLKASNNDGVWDKTPSSLEIHIASPFWLTGWAYFIYGLLILFMLMAFRKYTIIRTTKKHQLELEHLEKEKYEEVQRLKLEFFTNISHELRTPLTLIKGPLDYLRNNFEGLETKKVLEQFAFMHKNTNYLTRLVDQLLDFRKMDKGKMTLVLSKNNIVDFVHDMSEPFQFIAHKRSIELEVTASNKTINTWFDTDAVEKIINNLLSNAFKYSDKGGIITVSIFLQKKASKDSVEKCVTIRVRDTGCGISADEIEHIFERFYANPADIKNNTSRGAGIGLSYTKKLVQLHQGTIEAESELGVGSTFTVNLPVKKRAYANIQGIDLLNKKNKNGMPSTVTIESYEIYKHDEVIDNNISKKRPDLPIVLIVDDNSDIRAFIAQALCEKYITYEAENGEQALDIAKRLLPNIIITDVMMPIMDGFVLCEKLKTNTETSHIPVIMLTAKSSENSELQGLKKGADDYIRKPFDVSLLKQKLANIIKHREELRKLFNRKILLHPNEITVTSADEKFILKAVEIIERNMGNSDFSVEELSSSMNFGRTNLYLKCKAITGLSASEFIRNVRLKRAMQLLEKSDLSVKEIMYGTGFNTSSYFSKCFKKQYGVLPSQYVRQIRKVKKTT